MNKIAPHNTKIFKWFNFLNGFQLYSPIAIIFFSNVSHSYALGASILSVSFISSAIFQIPTGYISDTFGRKLTAQLASIFYVLDLLCYTFAHNYLLLFIGAATGGIVRALFTGNQDSLLYESVQQDMENGLDDVKYHERLGKTETFFHLAAVISALLGGLLATISLRAPFLLSIIPAIGMFFVSSMFIEPRHTVSVEEKAEYHIRDALKQFVHNSKLRIIAIATTLEFGIGQAMFNISAVFVNTLWPTWALGIVRALSGFNAMVSFWFSGAIINKFGALRTAFLSGAWSRSLSIIALAEPTMVSPVILSSTSLSFGSGTVAESTLLQNEFTPHQRAMLGSITSLAGSLCFGVASVAVGFLADSVGPAKAMLLGQIPLIIALLLYLRLRKHY